MSGPKKGEQCGAFFWKAGREASLANEGAVEGAAKEGGDRNGESYPPREGFSLLYLYFKIPSQTHQNQP